MPLNIYVGISKGDKKKDLEKAIHYCEMAIERDYPNEPELKGYN